MVFYEPPYPMADPLHETVQDFKCLLPAFALLMQPASILVADPWHVPSLGEEGRRSLIGRLRQRVKIIYPSGRWVLPALKTRKSIDVRRGFAPAAVVGTSGPVHICVREKQQVCVQ